MQPAVAVREMSRTVAQNHVSVVSGSAAQNHVSAGSSDEEVSGSVAQNHVSAGPSDEEVPIDSPTRTKTLDDDRTTKQVLKEWHEELYHVQDLENGPMSEMVCPKTPVRETTIVPVTINNKSRRGHGKSTARTSLKLSERIKEKARRQKEAHKKKKNKLKEIWEETEKGCEWSLDDDDIVNSDDETDATWWIGTRVAIETTMEEKTRKYLKSKEEEVCKQERKRKEKTSRGGKKGLCEVRDSINPSQ
ncbi:hypothetical protein PIB30_072590 [Stylosanthes scabra]|uniref:Uncharacterized protein n=1 Tax=Stylosanthes scabra TaxID=79078 RepID=A0ABU6XQQ1_9FABA|nr:hypothetical protein [Stylosanthes scabra]